MKLPSRKSATLLCVVRDSLSPLATAIPPHQVRPKSGVRQTQKLVDNRQIVKDIAASRREGQGIYEVQAREEGIGSSSRNVPTAR